MVKLELYIETSVWGFLLENNIPEKKRITEEFFEREKQKKDSLYISELVLFEINKISDENLKFKIMNKIRTVNPYILRYNSKIEDLAKKIIEMGTIPEKFVDDARHISYAIFYELDGIISWNMKHIVKFSTRKIVEAVCILNGFKKIEILTPEEVLYEF